VLLVGKLIMPETTRYIQLMGLKEALGCLLEEAMKNKIFTLLCFDHFGTLKKDPVFAEM